MFSALAKSVLAGAALSLALGAVAPKAAYAAEKAPLVLVQDAAAPAEGGGKVWFAFKWPDNMKPQLEEKKLLLTIIGVLFVGWGGGIWGPILLLGQSFDMEWALPVIVYTVLSYPGACFFYIGYFIVGWLGTQVMFANLNRPEIQVGGGEPAVK